MSRAWYYKHQDGRLPPRVQRRQQLRAEAARCFAAHEGKYGSPRITADLNPVSDPQQALRFLFHDCAPPTQQCALGTLRLFNPGPAVYQHAPGPMPPAITQAFILPTRDRTLRPEWMRQAAHQRLDAQSVEVDAGHCPHVSQPETIADILSQT